MRKLLIILLGVIAALILVGCTTTNQNYDLDYCDIVDVDAVSQQELFTRINLAFVDLFKKADSVIEYTDKDMGVIKGKYISYFQIGVNTIKTTSVVQADVKDGKYRLTMNLIDITQIKTLLGYCNVPKKCTPSLKTRINSEWIILAESLKHKVLNTESW